MAVVGGSLTSKQNTIRDSSSQGLGGAVLVESGDASFDGSTLQASSGQEGGGVYVDSGGSLSLIGVDCAEEGSLDNSPNDVATASDSWSWDGSCSATCDDQTCTDD